MKGLKEGGISWLVGKNFFNIVKMPCVKLSKNADPNEKEMPINADGMGYGRYKEKTAELKKPRKYKKSTVLDLMN